MSLEDWRGHKPRFISYHVKGTGVMKLFAGDELERHFSGRAELQKAIGALDRGEVIEMSRQNLTGFDFSGMDLRHVRFIGCTLRHACFDDADVTGMHIEGADMEGALISRAQLQATKGIPAVPPFSRLMAGRLHMVRRNNGPGF